MLEDSYDFDLSTLKMNLDNQLKNSLDTFIIHDPFHTYTYNYTYTADVVSFSVFLCRPPFSTFFSFSFSPRLHLHFFVC